ncbi:putative Co-chaperone HscB, C-terminal oligomerization domain-containing protein [Seiridium unicorne]|uniref:Co-chaperone HscB, C-terminal oligomerization domain-containing protein n=1 Tax=Seiridium unicorne TaxID=138068 RepID=A0ABR2UQE1_9PEZI
MRTSLAARGRQASRLCDVCKQQQRRNISISSYPSPRAVASSCSTPPKTPSSQRRIAHPQARMLSTTHPLRSEAADAQAASSAPSSSSGDAIPQTHYDFFPQTLPQGPPPAGHFTIDVRRLRREFLQLQGKAHPDLHPQHLKSRAEATSARINEAFKTLSSPLLRAQYLLSLQGLDIANDETAKVEDPELLMEVLEAREEIEEAAEESDLEPLRARNQVREEESIAELERCFSEGDMEAAVRECVKLRYWVNIAESIHSWEKGKPVVLEH